MLIFQLEINGIFFNSGCQGLKIYVRFSQKKRPFKKAWNREGTDCKKSLQLINDGKRGVSVESIWIKYQEYLNKLTFAVQIRLKWAPTIISHDFLEGNVGEFYTFANAGSQKVLIYQKETEGNFQLHYLATELPNAVFYPTLALLTFCQLHNPCGQSGCPVHCVNVQLHPWKLPTRCQKHPSPISQPQMSTYIDRCPLQRKQPPVKKQCSNVYLASLRRMLANP